MNTIIEYHINSTTSKVHATALNRKSQKETFNVLSSISGGRWNTQMMATSGLDNHYRSVVSGRSKWHPAVRRTRGFFGFHIFRLNNPVIPIGQTTTSRRSSGVSGCMRFTTCIYPGRRSHITLRNTTEMMLLCIHRRRRTGCDTLRDSRTWRHLVLHSCRRWSGRARHMLCTLITTNMMFRARNMSK